jgi:hypothetical protein
MKTVFWLALIGVMITVGGIIWYSLREWKRKQLAEEQRMASFLAATAARPKMVEAEPVPAALPVAPVIPAAGENVPAQKLLFEAAHKAGEAGEAAIAIQLYARLLSRFPQTAFADQARAAVQAQKKKLSKA